MRGWTKLLIAVVLIVLPVAGRWLWFHRGSYTAPIIPEIDESQIGVSLSEYGPSGEEPLEGAGRVVIDLSHQNNLEVDDLTPLRDRLSARGATVETFDELSGSLETQLRGATALVVIAPTLEYGVAEREAIADFVEDGGRLLLGADPTRPIPPEAEYEEDLVSILLPDSAIPAINSLADVFGVVYFDDYLYNLVENEGNYRNVKLTGFSDEQALTEGLEMVIFFASHSLRTDGLSLISGDENTFSSVRSGETDLTAVALAADERVLALGDITVLASPYHTMADNDRLLSNIAGWLAADVREWDLRDFPYLFEEPIDLVQAAGDFLDPRLIAYSGALERVLEQAGLALNVRATADADHDTLYVGVFKHVELVEEYLDTAGVTVTIVEAEEEEGAGAAEEAEEEKPQSAIEVEGLGKIPAKGTSLFVVDRTSDRVAVIVLAEDVDAVIEAMGRLVSANFSGCVQSQDVMVCSTGEVEEGWELETEGEEPQPTPTAEEEVEVSPRIGSQSESEDALAAGTPWLEELGEESYDVTSQAGETYTYTILMDRSQPVMWVYGWCAATEEQLEENWDNISVAFTLDGEAVALDRFAMLDSSLEDKECRLYYALVTDWPSGEYVLTSEVTFATEIDDGFDVYPAGTHVYEYLVTVAAG